MVSRFLCFLETIYLILRIDSESIALQSQGDGSFTQLDTLRNIWITTSLTDECMFHATLYAASAYLDLLRGQSGNVITLYHQTETLRLLSSQLAASNIQVTDALIAVTMALSQTEVGDIPPYLLLTSRANIFAHSYCIGSLWQCMRLWGT